jgi:hypothetical protein
MISCLFQTGNAQLWNPLETVPEPNSQSPGIGSSTIKSTQNYEKQENDTGEKVGENIVSPRSSNNSKSEMNIYSMNRQSIPNSTNDTNTMEEEKRDTAEHCKASNASETSKSVSHCGAMGVMQ